MGLSHRHTERLHRGRATIGLLGGLLLTSACATPRATLLDDAAEPAEMSHRLSEYRNGLDEWERRRVSGGDPESLTRARVWLQRLESEPAGSEMATLYEEAVRGQLEVFRTTALRSGARDSQVQEAPAAVVKP